MIQIYKKNRQILYKISFLWNNIIKIYQRENIPLLSA